MKKIYKLAVILILSCGQPTMAASTQASNDISDPNKAIIVTPQQPNFTIRLKANPTTGYTWILKAVNENYIDVVFQKYLAPNTKLIGAGGVSEFGFVAKTAAFKVSRQFTISFTYARPWEATPGTLTTFTIVTQAP